jgi:hypothetical protein
MMPRPEAANSAGSQFFISLNYERTKQLDGRYTAFATVIDGIEVVRAIAAVPLSDPETGRPQEPQVIKSVRVLPVTADRNPYQGILDLSPVSTTMPTLEPVPVPTTLPTPVPPLPQTP